MKIKLLASSLLMAGALMASGSASAFFWAGTVTDWINGTGTLNPPGPPPAQSPGKVRDADGDMQFEFLGLSGDFVGQGDWIDVVLDEVEIGGVDLYTVNFDFNFLNPASPFFDSGYTGNGSGDIEYLMTVAPTSNEWIASVALDSETVGNIGETVTKDLYDNITGNPFLTLTSVNGATVPPSGHTSFDPRKTVYVRDTFNPNGAIITHADNEFDVGVPEIDATSATSALTLLFGALGLLSNRRRPRADLMA